MAPPSNIVEIPILFAMVMQITPIVATLPKEVPVRKEIRQHSRNDTSSIHSLISLPTYKAIPRSADTLALSHW